MGLAFLLDTGILAEPVKQEPDPGVLEQLVSQESRFATCSLVWHRLLFALERLEEETQRGMLETYLRNIRPRLVMLPYDDEAAAWHAQERSRLETQGRSIPLLDSQIAAITATNDLTLVTAHPEVFQGFEGLSVVSW